jgi:23S rRNA pseudouridine1911/1915/1917 synthase
MEVIFCDNHILVVYKPSGLSTQPHPGSGSNLTDQAKAWIKKKYQKPGNVFLEPIHRLDKPVSGLVLFARTSKASSRLQQMMRQRQINKTYFAWVEGELPFTKGILEHFLVHDEHKARVVSSSHPEGKLARLSYTLLEKKEGLSLVEIDLETGRYHQIRAQFSFVGCPIVGDVKYGSSFPSKEGEILLHHGRLEVGHPVTKDPLLFEFEVDASREEVLKSIRSLQ